VPRIIARSFEEWLWTFSHGGREYWFDSSFVDLGDPWKGAIAVIPAAWTCLNGCARSPDRSCR